MSSTFEGNQFNRTNAFEEGILNSIGDKVYLELCSLDLDPIEVYKRRKKLEKDGKKILLIVGVNTEFGYLVSFILEDTEVKGEEVLTVSQALNKPVFSYTQNVTDDYCSEYGYVVVQKVGNHYKRVQ